MARAATITNKVETTTNQGGNNNNQGGNNHHPAPGPVMGAELPCFAIGYGVYWLVKRRRGSKNDG
jgi:hypothetical protein